MGDVFIQVLSSAAVDAESNRASLLIGLHVVIVGGRDTDVDLDHMNLRNADCSLAEEICGQAVIRLWVY